MYGHKWMGGFAQLCGGLNESWNSGENGRWE